MTDLKPEDLDAPEAGITPEQFKELEKQKKAAAKKDTAEGEAQAALVEGVTEEIDYKKQEAYRKIDAFLALDLRDMSDFRRCFFNYEVPYREFIKYPERVDEFWEKAMKLTDDLADLIFMFHPALWDEIRPQSKEMKDKFKERFSRIAPEDNEYYHLAEKVEEFLGEEIDFSEEEREKMFCDGRASERKAIDCRWDESSGCYVFTIKYNDFYVGRKDDFWYAGGTIMAVGKSRAEVEEIYATLEKTLPRELDRSSSSKTDARDDFWLKAESLIGEKMSLDDELIKGILEARRASDLKEIAGLSTEKLEGMLDNPENYEGFSLAARERLGAYLALKINIGRLDAQEKERLQAVDDRVEEGSYSVQQARTVKKDIMARFDQLRDKEERAFNDKLGRSFAEREDNLRRLARKGLFFVKEKGILGRKKFTTRESKKEELKDEVTQMAIEKQNKELYELKSGESVEEAKKRVLKEIKKRLKQIAEAAKKMEGAGRDLKHRSGYLTSLFKGLFEGNNNLTESGESQDNSVFLKDLMRDDRLVGPLLVDDESTNVSRELIDLLREYYPEEADLLVANTVGAQCYREDNAQGSAVEARARYYRVLYNQLKRLGLEISYEQMDGIDLEPWKKFMVNDDFVKALLFVRERTSGYYDNSIGRQVEGGMILRPRDHAGSDGSTAVYKELVDSLRKYSPEKTDRTVADLLDRLYTQSIREFRGYKGRYGKEWNETEESEKYKTLKNVFQELGLNVSYDELESFNPGNLKDINLASFFPRYEADISMTIDYFRLCEKHLNREELNKLIFDALFPSLIEDRKKKNQYKETILGFDDREPVNFRILTFLKDFGYVSLDQVREMIEEGEVLANEDKEEYRGLRDDLNVTRKAMNELWKEEISSRVAVVDDLSKSVGMSHEDLLKALQDPAVIEALKKAKGV